MPECPHCHTPYEPGQSYCQVCATNLLAEAAPAGEEPQPDPPPAPSGLSSWFRGALAGAGITLIIVLVLYLIFLRPAPSPAPPAAPGVSAAPATPSTNLQGQLQTVLSALRNAQMQKNISDFMKVYAPDFPDLEQKRKETLESWQNYDYVNLVFAVDQVKAIDPDHAQARVTWYADFRNRQTQEVASETQVFQVEFVKLSGNWRIHEVKQAQ